MNALVAYKNNYAQIIGKENNKFIIKTFANKEIKVREKDFRFLHPEFSIPNNKLSPDLSVLKELENEELTIKELSEWLFNEYTPNSAWQVFLITLDGLYCYFCGEKIIIRPQQQTNKILESRAIEEKQTKELENFVKNYNNKNYQELNNDIVDGIKKVALGQSKNHKIFKLLAIEPSPENALKFLHQTKLLAQDFNPYPARYKILTTQEINDNDYNIEIQEPVLDLIHLESYAIDNSNNSDADDAISIDGDRLWIHIVDVSAIGSELIEYALQRVSNLYLPDNVHMMLPKNITNMLSLNGVKTAFSIGCTLIDGQISNITINRSKIKVNNISYAEADNLIESKLKELHQAATKHKEFRTKNGAFSVDLPKINAKIINNEITINQTDNTPARTLVAEFMIIAGRAISEFAKTNNIPIPYISQKPSSIAEADKYRDLSLSEKFALLKKFSRSNINTTPETHSGMGIPCYSRITSPLRRFLDLITQQQILKFINSQKLLAEKQIQSFIDTSNRKIGVINRCGKDSENYYKLLYLKHHPLSYKAQVINKFSGKSLLFLLDIGLIGEIKQSLKLDEIINVRVKNIDIYNLTFDLILS